MPSITTQTVGSLESARVCYEVADIFRDYGQQYKRSRSLPVSHLKVAFLRGRHHLFDYVHGQHLHRGFGGDRHGAP